LCALVDNKKVSNIIDARCNHEVYNTARVACCWFIIYYRLVMHGNSNIKIQLIIFIVDEEFFYDVGSTRRKKVLLLGRTHQCIYLSGTYRLRNICKLLLK